MMQYIIMQYNRFQIRFQLILSHLPFANSQLVCEQRCSTLAHFVRFVPPPCALWRSARAARFAGGRLGILPAPGNSLAVPARKDRSALSYLTRASPAKPRLKNSKPLTTSKSVRGTTNRLNGTSFGIGAFGSTNAAHETFESVPSTRSTLKKCVGTATIAGGSPNIGYFISHSVGLGNPPCTRNCDFVATLDVAVSKLSLRLGRNKGPVATYVARDFSFPATSRTNCSNFAQ